VQVTPQLVGAILLAAGLAAFVLQNTKKVKVSWAIFDGTAPLWLILLITVAVTLVLGEVIGKAIRRSRKKD